MGLINYILNKANQIANSYSLTDKAQALTVQQQNPTTVNDQAYNDGGQYSPGQPLVPMNQGKPPWQWQYHVGRNLIVTPRSEDPGLTPFQVLRTLAETHDITAMCIKMITDQVTGDEWDIIPANKDDRNNYKDDIEDVKHFFWKPDKVHLFPDWKKMYLKDVLEIDAGTIYKRRTRNGKLYSLEIVDGSTIKPLIDAYGRVPQPPHAAYQQIIYGYPYGSAPQTLGGYTLNDIIYRPRYPRSWTPYGFAPTEQILMKINIMLRRDDFHLRYFTKGALPDAGLFQVDADWTPEQLDQYQQLWNDVMSGNLNERLAMRFVPKGTYTPTKEFKFDPQVDEWIARLVAISYGVNPLAFIMAMNRATGELQDQLQTDIGLQPLEKYLEEMFTDIIQNDLGYPHLRFKYIDEKKEDAKLTIQKNTDYVKSGLLSIDEIRSAEGNPPATDREGGVPPMVLVGNDVIFITKEFIDAKIQAQLKALEQGDYQVGNIQNQNLRIKQSQEFPKTSDKNIEPETKKKTNQKSFDDELKQFEKFALNRLKKKTKRKFEPDVLPIELVKMVNEQLETMHTQEEVKQLFNEVERLKKQSDLIGYFSDNLSDVFDELQEAMLDNADNVSEEDLHNDSDDAKKALILLLLLRGFDFEEKFKPVLTNMLTSYAKEAFLYAEKEINRLGDFSITDERRNEIIDSIVQDRMTFLLPEIEQATRKMVANSIYTADDINTLKTALQDVYAVSSDRANAIADIEYRTIENTTRIEAAKESGIVSGVLVFDGLEFDEPCINANGQIWSLDYAGSHILEHPRCVRQFTFLIQDEVEQHGGVDKE